MSKEKKQKKKRSKLRLTLTIVAFVLLLTGLGLLLFPPISNSYGKYVANSIADDFDARVENIKKMKNSKGNSNVIPDDESQDSGVDYRKVDVDKLYKDSLAYNKKIRDNQFDFLKSDFYFDKPALYLSDYGINDGVYGYVSIPSIDLKVPIYLGVQNNHMSYGAVHLTYTSLPLGDKRSKCVLAGHTGYVGRIFFDNIRQLKSGDVIKVVNYWGTVKYTVTGYEVIKPNEADNLVIQDDSTSIALVTCISDGKGGFDRYVVYGVRQ